MTEQFGYIPQKERKNVLLLCDDIRMHSGIATMAREFVTNSAQHFNWFNVGAAINHPEKGKILDLSADINKLKGLEDANVKVMPNNGYGDAALIRQLLKQQDFDAVFIFTDPRYWTWLFEIEREIRSQIPIVWLNIWDDYPAPKYNEHYYDSVDCLLAISKQTKNINELVLGDKIKSKVSKYVPHGINETVFKPLDVTDPKFVEFKTSLFGEKEIEYVVFFNSRNIHRKRPGDTILAFRHFCDQIGKEKAKKCALVMHTAPSDQNGTDLRAVKEAFCDPDYVNVYFSQDRLSGEQMNLLYNVADLTVLLSSNEGWGLALTESMLAGTMIAANVTGGMQDQMRFVDDKGEWIDFTSDFPSNHRGTVKECGDWAIPIFPTNISLAGSVSTPYIFDDRCSPEDAAKAMVEAYELGKEKRDENGAKGRAWAMSEEASMTATNMSIKIIEAMDETIETFIPRPKYEVHPPRERESKYITHKLIGY